ncbi:hypothetical protein EC990672_2859 [Escherichia coli 99.0672]|nr:hypothetical protein ECFRIK1985_3006 [Escherichia coli FRIK1985]EIN60583.1 hypothetical protein ECPA9_3006 [Escherichia coli PA9]EIO17474.1 hypothetical protein ECPA33_2901 [Escherichia coli PA33]EIO38361.1 hypothetical protein ECPA41_2903 [Escherichia coli PA41]EIP24656.1 hypothetical protein ECEC4422_2971 [Escherichia coli EC4422]EKJ11463.1 hypothetical protein ECEC1864_2967 [Escherichia coli EC1864]EKJ15478.1 hypothetical protein ECEC1865_2901 [Escherichia coli EC1865]EKK29104.1 hypoth
MRASFGFKRFTSGIRHRGKRAVVVGEYSAHQRFIVAKIEHIHVDLIYP